MPKRPSSTPKAPSAKPYEKKSKPAKERAIQTSTIGLYLTPGQFKFVREHRAEYQQNCRDPQQRLQYLRTFWRRFLDAYPEHNTPPFPEEEDMVENFHLSRARALGYKLDNIIDFSMGIQHRRKAD